MSIPKPLTNIQRISAAGVAALLWYLANDISGTFGWMLWIAPLPLLILALGSTAKQTFYFTFIAYLIGRLSWLPYLLLVIPMPLAIGFTVALPLFYAFTIIGVRKLSVSGNPWISLLAYPLAITTFEFLATRLSADGTAGSFAYTQSNYLPLIQIASVTGTLGIVFITALVSSALATAWHFKDQPKVRTRVLAVSGFVIITVHIFGWVRLQTPEPEFQIVVGLTVVNEKEHQFNNKPVIAAERKLANRYIAQIDDLANEGAEVILFPEKAIQAEESQKDSLVQWLKSAASEIEAGIIGGATIVKTSSRQNLALFVTNDGQLQQYKKNFHVTGWEDDFERGSTVGQLEGLPVIAGVAICKDMDFPQFIRGYHDNLIMFVPAWDFTVDGWLHSRMAMMRGIENGFTIVRAARLGRLTVSDPWGRVVAEVNCDDGKAGSLLAQAPIYNVGTVYGRFGDWFGWMCVVGLVGLIGVRAINK